MATRIVPRFKDMVRKEETFDLPYDEVDELGAVVRSGVFLDCQITGVEYGDCRSTSMVCEPVVFPKVNA